jgi:hypothetical protein
VVSIARFILSVRDVETRIGVTMNDDRSIYIEEYKLLGIISRQASVRCFVRYPLVILLTRKYIEILY